MAEEGRPPEFTVENGTKFNEVTLQKLENAFLKGMTNREACFKANISESLFYLVCEKTPELLERFKMLQEAVKMRAKEVVAEEIDKGNVQQANWYLERKAKDEFSPRQELSNPNGEPIGVILYPQKNGNQTENSLEAIANPGTSSAN